MKSYGITNDQIDQLIRINPTYHDVPVGHISIQMTGLKALKKLL